MLESENNYPEDCRDVGLTCEACTRASARELAAVCRGVSNEKIGQLFVQIYPDPACGSMQRHFAACYREATAPVMMPALALTAVA